jgi:DNA-binding NarL/FixJ family response regulator
MVVKVGIYIQNPIIRKWYGGLALNLIGLIDCHAFTSFDSLIKKFNEKNNQLQSSNVIMIEIENDLYIEYVNELKIRIQNIKLIACGYPKSVDEIKNLFNIGFMGFVDITLSELDFVKAVKEITIGNYYLPGDKINELIVDYISIENRLKTNTSGLDYNNDNNILNDSTISKYTLSEKEKKVVNYLLKGHSYKQIAELISITPFAINQRTKSIYKKCGVKSRSELSYLLLNK